MKRTLGIIFTLLMIMTAFIGCEMETGGDPLPPSENTETTPAGTVKIKTNYADDSVGAKERYYWGGVIEEEHFNTTVHTENGFNSGTGVPEGVLVQFSTNNGNTWSTITFGTTTYPQNVQELKIRAYLNGKQSLGGTTTMKLYQTKS